MNKMFLIFFLIVVSFSSLASAELNSFYPKALLLGIDGLKINVGTKYVTQLGIYDEAGALATLDSLNSLDTITSTFDVSYGLTNYFEINSGINLNYLSQTVSGSDLDSSIELGSYFFKGIFGINFFENKLNFSFGTGLKHYAGDDVDTDLDPNEVSLFLNGQYSLSQKTSLIAEGQYIMAAKNIESYYDYKGALAFDFGGWAFEAGTKGIYDLSFGRYSLAPFGALHIKEGSILFKCDLFYDYMGKNVNQNLGASISIAYLFKSSVRKTFSDKVKIREFTQYQILSAVKAVSSRGVFLRINSGESSDVVVGMKFDIFKKLDDGKSLLVAKGVIMEVKIDQSIIKLQEYYSEKSILAGDIARGYTD